MHKILFSTLTADTPSAALRLSAAWGGLSTESQMEVLLAIQNRGHLPFDVATKAMASPSAFVRYLTAECLMSRRKFEFSRDENGTATDMRLEIPEDFRSAWNAALIDSDPLVRSVVERTLGGFGQPSPETCEAFWALSKPARLRYLQSRDGFGGGRDVIALIDFAVARKRPDDEITEIVVEYVSIAKSRDLPGRFALLEFAKRAPGYAGFIQDELETPKPPNSLVAWVEPRVIPADKGEVYFNLKDPVGVVAQLSFVVCLWGTIIGLLSGVIELIRTGALNLLPSLVAIVLGTPLLLKSLLVRRVEDSDHPGSGSATSKRLLWIRRTWQLSWLLIVIFGVGATATVITVFGPAVDDAFRVLDVRLLMSANLLLLLFLMWRAANLPAMLRKSMTRPDA